MIPVFLGLGSNREYEGRSCIQLLARAVKALSKFMANSEISSVYRTAPMYVGEQDYFYNMVMAGVVSDSMTPHQLLDEIHEIEASLGRDRENEIRNGPRSIDIDIEYFGDFIINDDDLVIPHPRIKERAFVLVPMLEIFPKCAESLKGRNIRGAAQAVIMKDDPDIEMYMPVSEFFLNIGRD